MPKGFEKPRESEVLILFKIIYNEYIMVRNKIIFLRHAYPLKDPNVNAALWGLSEIGKKQAESVATLPDMNSVDVIYVSEEKKTTLTVLPLAQKIKKDFQPLAFFNEVKRGDKFLTKEEFEAEKIKQLENLSYRAFDGESGNAALSRFKQGINYIFKKNPDKTILVVTHGTILNIYFADLLNAYNELPQRWKKTVFCAYGIVEDGKILKDIIT